MKWIFFLIPLSIYANIFGEDNRLDYHDFQNEKLKELARSTPALVPKSKLTKVGSVYFSNQNKSLEENYNMCNDERFISEKQIANCSSALIKDDLILTAAHCFSLNPTNDYYYKNYYVVFGYYKEYKYQSFDFFDSDQVYEVKEAPLYKFNMRNNIQDIGILRLNKKTNYNPLSLNLHHNYNKKTNVFMLGYPLGISLKLSANSQIKSYNKKTNSFRHELDSFSVNSGSPIFDELNNQIIGVHVRGSVGNIIEREEENCREWKRAKISDFEEANTLDSSGYEIKTVLSQ